MPIAHAQTWNGYCTISYAAAHSAPAQSDLLDFCFAVDHVRLEAANLVRLLQHAEAAECDRGPVLRAHLPDLRHLQVELAGLVAEAEAA